MAAHSAPSLDTISEYEMRGIGSYQPYPSPVECQLKEKLGQALLGADLMVVMQMAQHQRLQEIWSLPHGPASLTSYLSIKTQMAMIMF